MKDDPYRVSIWFITTLTILIMSGCMISFSGDFQKIPAQQESGENNVN